MSQTLLGRTGRPDDVARMITVLASDLAAWVTGAVARRRRRLAGGLTRWTPTLIERLRDEMRYEFARTAPPEGFPAFHDIPAGRYTSDEFWELEQRHLWPRAWVLAGRVEDVAGRGDFVTFDDLGVPVLSCAARTTSSGRSTTRASTVARPSCATTAGSARTLRCQYHSWTYDITEGRLIVVPDERDFVGLDRAERCLRRLRCEIWDGWIFVNQDLDATPLLEWLAPIPEQLAELQGPDAAHGGAAQRGRAVQLEGHRRGVPRGVPLPPHPPARGREPPRQPRAPRWGCSPTARRG